MNASLINSAGYKKPHNIQPANEHFPKQKALNDKKLPAELNSEQMQQKSPEGVDVIRAAIKGVNDLLASAIDHLSESDLTRRICAIRVSSF